MIKAVFWDFGGVLTSSPFDNFNRYERENGLPVDFIRGVNTHNPDDNAWAKFESNRIGPDEFDILFADESRALGHQVRGSDVIALLKGEIRNDMVEALRRCNQHFKTACITNNVRGAAASGSDDPNPNYSKVFALFGTVIESSKIGIRKPDPEIYRLACEQVGVVPEDVVYLDDLGINLKPAKAMGMTTIKVGEAGPAIAELEKVLGISLSAVSNGSF